MASGEHKTWKGKESLAHTMSSFQGSFREQGSRDLSRVDNFKQPGAGDGEKERTRLFPSYRSSVWFMTFVRQFICAKGLGFDPSNSSASSTQCWLNKKKKRKKKSSRERDVVCKQLLLSATLQLKTRRSVAVVWVAFNAFVRHIKVNFPSSFMS